MPGLWQMQRHKAEGTARFCFPGTNPQQQLVERRKTAPHGAQLAQQAYQPFPPHGHLLGLTALAFGQHVQSTQIEAVFRSLKSELGIRPVYHQLEHRVDARILIAFLACCLQAMLKNRLMIHAPGLTPAAVLEKLAALQMIDVHIPTADGRCLILPRYTQPEAELRMILDRLKLELPAQPPPRITAHETTPAHVGVSG